MVLNIFRLLCKNNTARPLIINRSSVTRDMCPSCILKWVSGISIKACSKLAKYSNLFEISSKQDKQTTNTAETITA